MPQLEGRKTPDALSSLLRLVEECLRSLRASSAGACAQALPTAVPQLAALLAAESDAVRHAASSTLVALFQTCVSEEMAAADAVDEAAAGGRPGGLKRCVAALTAMLGASYRDAWPGVIRVLGAAFDAFGEAGRHLVEPPISRLADMCRCAPTRRRHGALHMHACLPRVPAVGLRCRRECLHKCCLCAGRWCLAARQGGTVCRHSHTGCLSCDHLTAARHGRHAGCCIIPTQTFQP